KNFSYFTNGIDPLFIQDINSLSTESSTDNSVRTILYAGNIGEGQGLHTIVPKVAKVLESDYKFRIIGDGGAKQKLINALAEYNVANVELINPVNRKELIEEYRRADILFLHLN